MLLPVGGQDTLAFLSCGTCLPSWEIKYVPIDKLPWSVVNREPNDRFKCPGAGGPLLGVSMGRRGDRLAAQAWLTTAVNDIAEGFNRLQSTK